MTRVLISAGPSASTEPLGEALSRGGIESVPHVLGATPAVDFSSINVGIIDVGERIDLAAAQTRRWRLELGDSILPVLWLLPEASAAIAREGYESGADACLPRSTPPETLLAQVKALTRLHAAASRLERKAGESLLLGDQLRKTRGILERERDLGRRIHRGMLPATLPAVGDTRCFVFHRPRHLSGGDFYDVRRLDEDHLGFFLGDVLGHGAAGSLLGGLVALSTGLKVITGNRYRLVPPEESLFELNRTLLSLSLEEPPLVAMLVGQLNVRDGSLTLARAGMPAPVCVPAAGEPEAWSIPGTCLGTSDTSCPPLRQTLHPGDRLLLASDGVRAAPNGPDPLLPAAARHRRLTGPELLDALARDLLPASDRPDDFTLLLIERVRL